ncbi:MAG: aldehyde-activating protein, partial [Rhodospirillaceae bacterium]|nr:aldehyde-activating protein [Rhodospirillaceae bacterium]
PQCGTSIWTEYSSPKFWFVRTTTLDNQQAFSPDIHIWTQSKQPWLQLPDGNPVFEQYYRREDVWPPDSLARFHAAIE